MTANSLRDRRELVAELLAEYGRNPTPALQAQLTHALDALHRAEAAAGTAQRN